MYLALFAPVPRRGGVAGQHHLQQALLTGSICPGGHNQLYAQIQGERGEDGAWLGEVALGDEHQQMPQHRQQALLVNVYVQYRHISVYKTVSFEPHRGARGGRRAGSGGPCTGGGPGTSEVRFGLFRQPSLQHGLHEPVAQRPQVLHAGQFRSVALFLDAHEEQQVVGDVVHRAGVLLNVTQQRLQTTIRQFCKLNRGNRVKHVLQRHAHVFGQKNDHFLLDVFALVAKLVSFVTVSHRAFQVRRGHEQNRDVH
mmetsp:Transcript_62674/g.110626  ORF Transcript_62674/g.110626 Transcript_62674/m.110626 type:complete len:254 (+) Transcript_62674:650-1411(+)